MDDALAHIRSSKPGECFSYVQVARIYGVDRKTLARQHQGKQLSRKAFYATRSKLSTEQKEWLVVYIQKLTARHLSPTRSIVRNFAEKLAGSTLTEDWVSQFITRHHDRLTSRWAVAMDVDRHRADSVLKYELYFQLLEEIIKEYNLVKGQIHSMDEKGFLLGHLGRSRRVFDKASWEAKSINAPLQDGSHT